MTPHREAPGEAGSTIHKVPFEGNLKIRWGWGRRGRGASEFGGKGRKRENTKEYPRVAGKHEFGKSVWQAHGVLFPFVSAC